MESGEIKNRTEKLKQNINSLLLEYIKETDLVPEAFQGILEKDGYKIDLGIRL